MLSTSGEFVSTASSRSKLSIENSGTEAPSRKRESLAARSVSAASPLRVTSGVLALAIGAWSALFAAVRLFTKGSLGGPSTPFVGWMNFLIILGAVGCLVTGIVIIVKQKKRGGATPYLVAGFDALLLIAALGLGTLVYSGTPGGDRITLFAAVVVLLSAGAVILHERSKR